MDPEPLIRMAADNRFEHFSISCRIDEDILSLIAGRYCFDRIFKMEPMYACPFIPDQISGQDDGLCPQSQGCHSRSCARIDTEKIAKYSLFACGVQIGEYPYHSTGPQGPQYLTHGIFFVDPVVAIPGAATFRQSFDQRIVDRPGEEGHRMTIN